MATRLQVAVYNTLVVDVITESLGEADRIFAKWSVARWKKKLPIGGAIISSAELPRMWDVPVGDTIKTMKIDVDNNRQVEELTSTIRR